VVLGGGFGNARTIFPIKPNGVVGGGQTAKTPTTIQKLQPLKTANDIDDDGEVEKYQSMWVHLCVMNINEAQRA